MNNVLLPIGSAVLLEGAETELVVIGYAGIDANGCAHDYTGVPYPAGLVTKDALFLFDAAQIEQVRYYGYSDLRLQAFEAKILEGVRDGIVSMPLFSDTTASSAEQASGAAHAAPSVISPLS